MLYDRMNGFKFDNVEARPSGAESSFKANLKDPLQAVRVQLKPSKLEVRIFRQAVRTADRLQTSIASISSRTMYKLYTVSRFGIRGLCALQSRLVGNMSCPANVFLGASRPSVFIRREPPSGMRVGSFTTASAIPYNLKVSCTGPRRKTLENNAIPRNADKK